MNPIFESSFEELYANAVKAFPNTTKRLSLFILKNLKHIFVSTYYITDFSDPNSLYGKTAIELHHWLH